MLAIVVLFSTIFTFSDFNIVYVLTHGGPINSTHLFATLARQIGLESGQIGQGAADLALPVPGAGARGVGQLRSCGGRRTDGGQAAPGAEEDPAASGLLPFLIFALFPFYHMTLTSLKTDRELYDRTAVLLIRQGPTLEHYQKLLWETGS